MPVHHARELVRPALRRTTTWRLWIGATSGPGSVVSIVKEGGWLPAPSRQRPAIAMTLTFPFSVNRCFAFGYFLPENSGPS